MGKFADKRMLKGADRARYAILAKRLKTEPEEAARIVKKICSDVAIILQLPRGLLKQELEFNGADFDLVMTISKQNKSNKDK